MSNIREIFENKEWRFWDQSISGRARSALESFAADDMLCELVGKGMSFPTIRTWVHENTVVLGIQDHRLPHIEAGREVLNQHGYQSIVRNSGGLAVVLDSGVLNISLVVSEKNKAIDINAGYDIMVEFVRNLFPQIAKRIQAYEIVGSYCPGSYDLSVNGKKFAGISQRRLRHGIAVQVYLCIEGSGAERAAYIREFYEKALQGEQTKFIYPDIMPDVMRSVSEIMGQSVTVQDTVFNAQRLMNDMMQNVQRTSLQPSETDLYLYYLTRIVERNKKYLG
ncbi:lipoate--protein ligase family protein [Paenisporosarcina sp. TG20]|uniref:lipoate--protein ligase family protein n=1 Tax=Paenisporosarcina sp. TG20 TaxID=1211706 RepID=UPI00030BF52F|nr:lipoate--protein ligase family protein [Paenisporosarcina sp. TG20]